RCRSAAQAPPPAPCNKRFTQGRVRWMFLFCGCFLEPRPYLMRLVGRGHVMEQKFIEVRGAREHNLKGVDMDIPRDKLVVITGLSGSGKSSLAFDTIYAEGQRRYVESLSAYARQFLDMMGK